MYVILVPLGYGKDGAAAGVWDEHGWVGVEAVGGGDQVKPSGFCPLVGALGPAVGTLSPDALVVSVHAASGGVMC